MAENAGDATEQHVGEVGQEDTCRGPGTGSGYPGPPLERQGGPPKSKGKGKAPPPPKGGFQKPSDKPVELVEAALGEGATVEVARGQYAGRRGIVLKVVPGEGTEVRWRVQLESGGPSTWVDEVRRPSEGHGGGEGDMAAIAPASAGTGAASPEGHDARPPPPKAQVLPKPPMPKVSAPSLDHLGEGAQVEVTAGPHIGRRGKVVKVSPDEPGQTRWRVELDGGGPTTWVDGVQAAGATATAVASSAAVAPVGQEGTRVEVVGGQHDGRCGLVLKVSTGEDGSRWRVLIDGGAPTWVDGVRAVGGAVAHQQVSPARAGPPAAAVAHASAPVPTGPRPPIPVPNDFLFDDSESEATDAEMPDLVPL